jgi:uncharacterized protein YqgC (DUF456 family)
MEEIAEAVEGGWLAFTTIVFGVVSLIPFFGLIFIPGAFICGYFFSRNVDQSARDAALVARGKRLAWVGVVIAVISLALVVFVFLLSSPPFMT